jgi:hypothetical protein
LYRDEAVLPEEIKHRSPQTVKEVHPCPTQAEDKDLLEPNRLKAVTKLQRYQDEMRAWRDPKVNLIEFNEGDLVLLRSPHTKSSGKLESK